jgi:uncharacterized protein
MPTCPTCNRPIQWNPASPWRPFCSERCKLIDLGAWASERHAIPGDANNTDAIDELPIAQPGKDSPE